MGLLDCECWNWYVHQLLGFYHHKLAMVIFQSHVHIHTYTHTHANPHTCTNIHTHIQNNPAENLLTEEVYRKWRCAHPGEKQLTAVIQVRTRHSWVFSSRPINIEVTCASVLMVWLA